MDEYQSMDSLGSPTRESEQELKLFVPFVTLAQILGLASVVVTAVWMGHYWKGFQWSSDEVFNYHPLFMVIGMVFLYADSILAYRVFRNSNKRPVKFLHAGLHIGALVFSIVGLIAVFDFHNKKGIANLYSFHSWLGITVVGLFGLQWLVGFLIYLLPCAGNDLRAAMMPFHRGLGVGIFVLSIGTALLGITEKNIFSGGYAKLEVRERFGNVLSILLVLFGAVVVYIVTKFEYRRVDLVTSERIRLSN